MNAPDDAERRRVVLIRELAAGTAGVVVASFAAVVLSPEVDLTERALVMAVACGVLSAWLTDWRAIAAVAAATLASFVVVLAEGAPNPTESWGVTPLFALAVFLGVGNRMLRSALDRGDQRNPQL